MLNEKKSIEEIKRLKITVLNRKIQDVKEKFAIIRSLSNEIFKTADICVFNKTEKGLVTYFSNSSIFEGVSGLYIFFLEKSWFSLRSTSIHARKFSRESRI
jgi:hypothetical protein